MRRALVAVVAGLLIIVVAAGAAPAWNWFSPPQPCAPPCAPPCPPPTFVTKMIPCTRTEIVADVQPVVQCINVPKIAYRPQKFLLKGIPVGQPCGLDPCTKCCPQPFCEVVQQPVPYVYYEQKKIQSYNVSYRPVCRPVMLPQTYMVKAYPMCQ